MRTRSLTSPHTSSTARTPLRTSSTARTPLRITSAALLTIGGLALAACAPSSNSGSSSSSESKTITVGVVTSETGALASYGKQYLDGLKAGMDYATGGTNTVDGITIKLDIVDDAGDPDKAVTATKDFVGKGTTIIAGSASSGVAGVVAEQAAQNKVLFISGPAAADSLTGINKYTFRSGRQSAQDVATVGTFLDNLNGKKIAVLAQNNAFGKGNASAVEAILGAKGASVESVLVAEDVTEFTPFAQKVLDTGADLAFVAWAGATTGAMWQSMSQQGVFDKLPVVTGLGDSSTFGAYGASSEKIQFLNHYFPGATDNKVNEEMIAKVKSNGGTPDLFTPDGFNAALMIVQAVKSGKGTNVDDMIKGLEGYSFDGPKGTTTVRAGDHALLQNMYRVQLVAYGSTYTPKLVATVDAHDVAPAEKS